MTEEYRPVRARVTDLLRPGRLYEGIDAHPAFVIPMFLFVACVMTYTQTAFGYALPKIVPALLEGSQSTETELVRAYRMMILVVSFIAPCVFIVLTAFAVWGLTRGSKARPPFPVVLSLIAHSSLWVGLGFLAKAALVAATGNPEPSVNLGLLVRPAEPVSRVLLAFTNPFLVLALVWTKRGLKAWGVGGLASGVGGGGPWVAWIVGLALLGAGSGPRFAPASPVSYEGWKTAEKEHVSLRYPVVSRSVADETAEILDGFTRQLGERLQFEPRPLRVNLYRDHAELEHATGEFLHVQVTGSIRGRDLLYLETPGRSAALPREDGLRDALRYIALMQLASPARLAPRWFVEGFAHATAVPHSPKLESDYRALLREMGTPSYDMLADERLYRTPEGPLLARSLVDHLAFRHGRDSLEGILSDVIEGTPFRDALYARTRLTTSALEASWQSAAQDLLSGLPSTDDETADDAIPAPATEGEGEGGVQPFRERR